MSCILYFLLREAILNAYLFYLPKIPYGTLYIFRDLSASGHSMTSPTVCLGQSGQGTKGRRADTFVPLPSSGHLVSVSRKRKRKEKVCLPCYGGFTLNQRTIRAHIQILHPFIAQTFHTPFFCLCFLGHFFFFQFGNTDCPSMKKFNSHFYGRELFTPSPGTLCFVPYWLCNSYSSVSFSVKWGSYYHPRRVTMESK